MASSVQLAFAKKISDVLLPVQTDSPCFHSHLIGLLQVGHVHIGVLSISVALQSFRRLLKTRKKHAVTVNTVYPLSQPNFLRASQTVLLQLDCGSADPGDHPVALCKG